MAQVPEYFEVCVAGRVRGVRRSVEAGLEADPELPWAVVCEDHGGIVCTATRAQARTAMSGPDEWCPTCSGQEAAP